MSNWLEIVTTGVKRTAGTVSLKAKEKSPELLLGAGIILGIATVVVACKETLHAEEILDEHKEKIDKIHSNAQDIIENDPEAVESEVVATEKKAVTARYIKTTGKFLKLYAPAIALGTASLVCILVSHNTLKKRYLGVVAAYEALDSAFKAYRSRVAEEFGEEVEERIRHGYKNEKVEVEGEDGKTHKEEAKIFEKEKGMPSPYAKFFDEGCEGWRKDPELNLIYLRAKQEMFTDRLRARGHLFLNEVYDELDIPRTPAGAVVGWKLGMGDDYVDLGLYSGYDRGRDFVNGYERSILLDFNVAGVIYDKL